MKIFLNILYIVIFLLPVKAEAKQKVCINIKAEKNFFQKSELKNESIEVSYIKGGKALPDGQVEGGKEANILVKVVENPIKTCTDVPSRSSNLLKFRNKQPIEEKITGIRASLAINTRDGKGYGIECNHLRDREYLIGSFKDNININVYLSRIVEIATGKSFEKCKIEIT